MDWNNDGILDLVFGEREGHLNLYTGNGDGTLHYVSHICDDEGIEIMTNFNSSPYLVDWNEDGRLDLLLTGYLTEITTGGILRVYPGVGDDPDSPAFDADYLDYTGFYDQWRTTAQPFDLDGDGDKDLVLGYEMGEVYYASNSGTNDNPQFSSYSVLQCDAGPMNVYTSFAGGGRARENVCDYNSDGIPDLLVGCSNGWLYCFLGYYPGGTGDDPSAECLSLSILGTPSVGSFTYRLGVPSGAAASLTVFDASGRIVAGIGDAQAGIGTLDMAGAPAGMYVVTAWCEGQSATARVVKL